MVSTAVQGGSLPYCSLEASSQLTPYGVNDEEEAIHDNQGGNIVERYLKPSKFLTLAVASRMATLSGRSLR